MTIFGKVLFGLFFLGVLTSVFYGVTTYMKEDIGNNRPIAKNENVTTGITNELSTTTKEDTTKESTSTKNEKKIAFTEFIKQGGSYKCSVVQTVANMTSNGTIYTDGGRIRGEFSTTMSGQSINTNMIIKDGYTYTWTSLMPNKGYKAKAVNNSVNATNKEKSTYTWNGEQIGEYDCNIFKVDEALFDLPKDVVFVEV